MDEVAGARLGAFLLFVQLMAINGVVHNFWDIQPEVHPSLRVSWQDLWHAGRRVAWGVGRRLFS